MGLTVEELYEEMSEHDIVVATAQFFTQNQRCALLRELSNEHGPLFDLVIFDECHYLPTTSWTRVWESLKGACQAVGMVEGRTLTALAARLRRTAPCSFLTHNRPSLECNLTLLST